MPSAQLSMETYGLASERIDAAGLGHMSLQDLPMPTVELAPNGDRAPVGLVFVGDRDAPRRLYVPNPSLTGLEPHAVVRLLTYKAALGDEVAVVGMLSHQAGVYDRTERRQLKQARIAPVTERALAVVRHTLPVEDAAADIMFAGHSTSADVAADALARLHEQRTDYPNVRLTGGLLIEPVRTAPGRPMPKLAIDAARSAGDMNANVARSDIPALDEAWPLHNGIQYARLGDEYDGPLSMPQPGDQPDRLGTSALDQYRRIRDNISYLHMTRRSRAAQDARYLARNGVPITVVQFDGSRVSRQRPFREIERHQPQPNFYHVIESGDHSAAENLRLAAALVLQAAQIEPQSTAAA